MHRLVQPLAYRPTAPKLNYRHPLARWLLEAFDSAANYSLLNKGFGTITSGPLSRPVGIERMRGFASGGGGTDVNDSILLPFSFDQTAFPNPHAMMFRMHWSGTQAGYLQRYVLTEDTSFENFLDRLGTGGGDMGYNLSTSGTAWRATYGVMPTVACTVLIFIPNSSQTTPEIPWGFINGVDVTPSGWNQTGTGNLVTGTGFRYYLGNRSSGGRAFIWYLGDFFFWGGPGFSMTRDMGRSLTANPWQLYENPATIWLPSAAAASGVPTLSAATAVSITATTATPRVTLTF